MQLRLLPARGKGMVELHIPLHKKRVTRELSWEEEDAR